MKTITRIAFSAAIIGIAAQATATERVWYVAPSVSYIFADDNRQADDDFGIQLGLGKELSERWNLEASAVYDKLDRSSGNNSFSQRGLLLDALYKFDNDRRMDPYLVFGLGAMKNKLAGRDNTNLFANVGIGVMNRVSDHLNLRADIRYRYDQDDNSIPTEDQFGDWVLNVGLTIPFAGGKPHKAMAAAMPMETMMDNSDSDGDGVNDDRDECAGTPAGTRVMANGCESDRDSDGIPDQQDRCPNSPEGAIVDSLGCENDSDGDGVVDRLDRCGNTASGVVVDKQGCALDTDGDGIANAADRCPNTATGAKVDVHGCQIQDRIVLKGVNFATASDRLTADSTRVLDDAAATLLAHPELTIEVAGYTDNRGSRGYNIRLSQARAEAVVAYFISKGVAASRLTAVGYGPANPIASNDTAEGRLQNRRVELHITE